MVIRESNERFITGSGPEDMGGSGIAHPPGLRGARVRFESLREGAEFYVYYAHSIHKKFQKHTMDNGDVEINAILLDEPDQRNPQFQFFQPEAVVYI